MVPKRKKKEISPKGFSRAPKHGERDEKGLKGEKKGKMKIPRREEIKTRGAQKKSK